jgi:hypothetical protein
MINFVIKSYITDWIVKFEELKRAWHAVSMIVNRNTRRIQVGPLRKRTLGRQRRRWKDAINMNIGEIVDF